MPLVSAHRPPWVYPLDPALIDRTRNALHNDYGIVLEGDVGSGRRQVAQQILDGLDGYIHVVEFASLVEMRSHEAEDRQDMVQSIRDALQRKSGGLPITVYVGSRHMLSEEWLAILRGLVTRGGISVLMLSYETNRAIGQGISGIEYLERIRIWPLSINDTEDWLRVVLGGTLSWTASLHLWEAAGGQRHFLEVLTLDWIQSGYLRATDNGIWVVSGPQGPLGAHTAGLWNRILQSMPSGQRKSIDIVALSGRIPLSALLKVVSAEDLDNVVEAGFLKLDSGYQHTVRFRATAAADAVFSYVSPGRAAELLRIMRDQTDESSGVDSERIFDWERYSGLAASEFQILAEAERAVLNGNSMRALELLPGALGLSATPRYLAARLHSLIQLGHMSAAKEATFGLPTVQWLLDEDSGTLDWPALLNEEDKVAEVRLAIELIRYFAYFEGLAETQQNKWIERVRDIVHYLYANSLLGDDAYTSVLAQTDLVVAQLSLYHGRPSLASSRPYIHTGLTGNLLRQWQAAIDSAGVLRGHVAEHIGRRNEKTLMVHQSDESETVKWESRLQLFELKIVAGEWKAARDILDGSWIGGKAASNMEQEGRLYAGLLESLMGHHEEAISTLVTELDQLQAYDPLHLSKLARAAAACSNASMGNFRAAQAELFAQNSSRPGRSHTSNKLEILFRAHALHDIGKRGEALALLGDALEEDRDKDDVAWAMLEAGAAISMGHDDFLPVLGELSGVASGRYADACGRLAAGTKKRRDDVVTLAANALADLGHYRLSAWGLEMAARLGDGNSANGTGQLRNWPHLVDDDAQGALASSPGGDESGMPEGQDRTIHVQWKRYAEEKLGLTKRQADIAHMAGHGHNNREIAEHLNLSVRTVESHLYQVFGKLGLRKRSDLIRLLREQEPIRGGDTGKRK